jgi:tetratricopeptide (TPR) repeat protein
MADRYALLPSLSWCVLLAYWLSKLWHWRLSSSRFSPEFPLLISAALLFVIVTSYSYMTFRQNDIWKNSQTLWEDTLAKYPNSSPANVNLAAIYLTQMRFKNVQDLCLTAIKEKPYDYLAISNLALAQVMMGQYDNAIHNYQQALRLKPDLYKAKKGLALAYWHGKDYANAYALLSGLLAAGLIGGGDDLVQYYYRTGYAAWKIGKKDDAYAYLDKAMKYGDQSPRLLDDIALAYTSMGDLPKAKAALEELYPKLKDDDTKRQLKGILEKFDRKMRRQTY